MKKVLFIIMMVFVMFSCKNSTTPEIVGTDHFVDKGLLGEPWGIDERIEFVDESNFNYYHRENFISTGTYTIDSTGNFTMNYSGSNDSWSGSYEIILDSSGKYEKLVGTNSANINESVDLIRIIDPSLDWRLVGDGWYDEDGINAHIDFKPDGTLIEHYDSGSFRVGSWYIDQFFHIDFSADGGPDTEYYFSIYDHGMSGVYLDYKLNPNSWATSLYREIDIFN